jgi:hypothetical protein
MSVYKIYNNNNNSITQIICFVKSICIQNDIDIDLLDTTFKSDPSDSLFEEIFLKKYLVEKK